jgi:hypothetical protein
VAFGTIDLLTRGTVGPRRWRQWLERVSGVFGREGQSVLLHHCRLRLHFDRRRENVRVQPRS